MRQFKVVSMLSKVKSAKRRQACKMLEVLGAWRLPRQRFIEYHHPRPRL